MAPRRSLALVTTIASSAPALRPVFPAPASSGDACTHVQASATPWRLSTEASLGAADLLGCKRSHAVAIGRPRHGPCMHTCACDFLFKSDRRSQTTACRPGTPTPSRRRQWAAHPWRAADDAGRVEERVREISSSCIAPRDLGDRTDDVDDDAGLIRPVEVHGKVGTSAWRYEWCRKRASHSCDNHLTQHGKINGTEESTNKCTNQAWHLSRLRGCGYQADGLTSLLRKAPRPRQSDRNSQAILVPRRKRSPWIGQRLSGFLWSREIPPVVRATLASGCNASITLHSDHHDIRDQAAAYTAELAKMPSTELSRLHATELEVERQERVRAADEEEQRRFFHSPSATADFEYWCKAAYIGP